MKDMIPIAIDAGRSEIRATDGRNFVNFPNLISPLVTVSYGTKNEGSYDVRLGLDEYTIGAAAAKHDYGAPVLSSSKTDSETIAMILTAIAAIVEKRGNTISSVSITLAVGSPIYRYQADKGPIISALKKGHEITVNGKRIMLNIDDIIVVPEGYGVFYNEYTRNPDLEHGYTAIIDIGQRTTDWLLVFNGEMADKFSGGGEMGIFTVCDNIRKEITTTNGVTLEYDQIEQAIRTNNLVIKTGTGNIDLSNILDKVKKEITNGIVKGIRASWSDKIPLIHNIIVAGGGGTLLIDNVRQALRGHNTNIKLAENARYANLSGFFKLIED